MQYLSAEWVEAAGRALAGARDMGDAAADLDLTVEQVVTGVPGPHGGTGGTVVWHVTFDHGKVALDAGPAPAADLRFSTDYPTAAAIAAGRLGAQRAFAEGRLRVGGDLRLLAAHQRAVAALDDALATVRSRTTF
ncbi:MAG TPA: SCP2 sterol-binding domain-containing protein [Acidimicrobiales bacterium]|nr:SCP2 sterol-binding domain-containing protein [Acidimicrobiales bacterium]